MTTNRVKVKIETGSYNDRRYGKPWFAFIDFDGNKKGNFHFVEWIGQKGESGLFHVEVADGQIIARGQKDFKKPRNSAPDFYIVTIDKGEASFIPVSLSVAYQHYLGGVQ